MDNLTISYPTKVPRGTSGSDLMVRIVFKLLDALPRFDYTHDRVSFDNWYASAGLVSTLDY